ncbi:MAG TPA: carboxypeptidase-like regulatory domain-containing protein, partial [Ohtaekwangia sp.]|nr:carboxypeptidase-like regulatory domain-containing protein [Ohtaekwangia sp.]
MVNNYITKATWQRSTTGTANGYCRRSAGKLSLRNLLMLLAMLLYAGAYAQEQKTVSGTVRDENGDGLPGVSIVLKGSAGVGTTTESNGVYTLTLPASESSPVLVFSFIGYQSQEVSVGNQSQIDVQFEPDLTTLGEVVVVGYGTQNRKDVTGAIASLSQENMNQGAIANPLQQIAGRAPGVSVTQISSEPGATPSVRIRGITSLRGGNDPLVVVDGIQG